MAIKVKTILMLVIFIALPYTVRADCILTETSEKFEIICSGPGSLSSPADLKKNGKSMKKVPRAKKVSYEERENKMQGISMSDKESQFMQTMNRLDGQRDKRNPGKQASKQVIDGQHNKI